MNDKVYEILERSLTNISRSYVDNYIKENAQFRSRSGLKTRIIRDSHGKCCKWCAEIDGVYDYPAPQDVYRRHDNCTCTVTYESEKGQQNVWTKEWEETEKSTRKEANSKITNEFLNLYEIRDIMAQKNTEKCEIEVKKIKDFLLKPGAKHYEEFVMVGYTTDDVQMLYDDIMAQFDDTKIINNPKYENRFSIMMELGKNKVRLFQTIWLKEDNGKARFITAHRK